MNKQLLGLICFFSTFQKNPKKRYKNKNTCLLLVCERIELLNHTFMALILKIYVFPPGLGAEMEVRKLETDRRSLFARHVLF